ncbi:hypothetical protein [Pseudomonas putida]|uniref:hypothetical protein n=1 Tax=Pseudomonas putida TaxID=303 RepID=UPI000579303D|nr:hypothetical protein [Pseudomonas putida]
MPTENRSSNTEQVVSVPRDWAENYAGLLEDRCAYVRAEQVNALLAQPAAQHQGEPVAYWVIDEFGQKKVVLPGSETVARGKARGYAMRPLYFHPPTSDGFSAGDMADQGAKAFRDGQRALVLPDRELYTKYLPGVTPRNAAEVNGYKDGWNACLEEVSRLNAAAIAQE